MVDFIYIVSVTVIWCIGLTIATQVDMIFYKLRTWADGVGKIYTKPLILCIWCMPSIHSLFGFLFSYLCGFVEFSYQHVFYYPIVVMAASVISGTLWSLCNLVEVASRYMHNAEQLSYFELKDRKGRYLLRKNNSESKNNNHGYQKKHS